MNTQWETTPKIVISAGIITLLIASAYFIYIGPHYQQGQKMRKKQQTLQQLIQKKEQQLKQITQKKQQYAQLQKKYNAMIRKMDHHLTINTTIAQITKQNKITMAQFKPIKEEAFFNFKKKTISLEVKGSEQSLLIFIKQLQNQPWLVDMPEWQLQTTATDIIFKATLEIYDATNKTTA